MRAASRAAGASDLAAEQSAAMALNDGGNAIDAVVAGFLGAAAARRSVLLSPLAAMVGGVGMGVRMIDGRSCQPGRGLPRPRGFRKEDAPPPAAYAAAPRSLSAVALLHGYGGARSLSSLAKKAAASARRLGSPRRAELLAALGRHGAAALTARDVARALLGAAGPAAGGLLSQADLGEARPGDERPRLHERGSLAISLPGFAGPERGRPAEIVVAADASGLVAALAFSPDDDGVEVAELDVVMPRDAAPVRRGVPRVAPGTPCPAALPIALLQQRRERWLAAVGVRAARMLDARGLDDAPDPLEALRSSVNGTLALSAAAQGRRVTLRRCLLEP